MKKEDIEKKDAKDFFEQILNLLGQERYIELKKELGIPLERYEMIFDLMVSPSFLVRRLLNDRKNK